MNRTGTKSVGSAASGLEELALHELAESDRTDDSAARRRTEAMESKLGRGAMPRR